MEDKLVWSSNMTRDNLLSLDESSKMTALVNREYDREMLEGMDLDTVIKNDKYMFQEDLSNFEADILPMIEDQTKDGMIVVMNEDECYILPADELTGSYNSSYNDYDLKDKNGDLYWVNNGVEYELFAIPEDYDFDEDNGGESLEDPQYVLQNCDHIRNLADLDLNDEQLEEAKSSNPEELRKEVDEIKPLANEYGYQYFTSMPFSNFDNDQESIEYQYPEFAEQVKSFFKEMKILSKEETENSDIMDEHWDIDIDEHDFNIILDACDEKIANGMSVQYEKEFKKGFDDGLKSDKEILADREQKEESLTEAEEEGLGKRNAERFLQYLNDHDVKSGGFDQDDPKVFGFDTGAGIHLDSQAASCDLHFYDNGTISVDMEDFSGDDSVNENETFSSWNEMVDWMKADHWTWSDDYGADLPVDAEERSEEESLNEDVNIDKLKETIVDDFMMTYLEGIDDNYAREASAKWPQYDIEWCNEDGTNVIAQKIDEAKYELARAIVDSLFANAPKQESLEEDAYTKDELMNKFGTDNLDLINAGNEEDVTLLDLGDGITLEADDQDTMDMIKNILADAPKEESLNEDTLTEPQGDDANYSRTVDWVTEATTEGELIDEIRSYGLPESGDGLKGVKITVDSMMNDANGWATVTFTGDKDTIDQFLEDAGFDE